MNFKQKIKELFSSIEEVKLEKTEVVLIDGTKVMVEGPFEVGSKVTVMDSEGMEMPAPVGDHTLEDEKTVVTVDSEGVITEIKEVSEEDEQEDETAADEPVIETLNEEMMKEIAELLNALVDRADSFETEVREQFQKMDERLTEIERIAGDVAATEESDDSTEKFNALDKTIEKRKKALGLLFNRK